MEITLAVLISIVAIWEYRKRQQRGELPPVSKTNHWGQAVIVGLVILGLIVFGIYRAYDWLTAVSAAYLMFIFLVLPAFGVFVVYVFLRLMFATIHRLER